MKAIVAITMMLIVGLAYLATYEVALAEIVSGGAITTQQRAASALTGRLFGGLTDIPVGDGYVFALALDGNTVLGWSKTLSGRGPDSGRWQIASLPASGDILLVGFDPSIKSSIAAKEVILEGRFQDVGVLFTEVAVPSSGPDELKAGGGLWNLLTLAGWISQGISMANANQEATKLADHLLDWLDPSPIILRRAIPGPDIPHIESWLSFSPDGRLLAIAYDSSPGCSLELWDIRAHSIIASLPFNDAPDWFGFSPSGGLLWVVDDIILSVWSVETGREVFTFGYHDDDTGVYKQGVRAVEQFPDKDALAIALYSFPYDVRILDMTSGKILGTLTGFERHVSSLTVSPNGKILAITSSDELAPLKFWNIETRKVTELTELRSRRNVEFSPDGKLLATTDENDNVVLLDALTGKRKMEFPADAEGVDFSPDGKVLITMTGSGSARLWDLSLGKEIKSALSDEKEIIYVFCPTGKVLATWIESDCNVRLWNYATGKEMRVLKGHEYEVETAAFAPNGKYLATSSAESVILWNMSD